MKFYSRSEFKRLPLQFILAVSLDAPVLLFDESPTLNDSHGRAVCPAYPKLAELRRSYPGSRDSVRFKLFVRELRRLWSQMVSQARGYTFPGANHYGVPVEWEFADDV